MFDLTASGYQGTSDHWPRLPTTSDVHALGRAGTTAHVVTRAFPVIYARDVERLAAFYIRLGFQENVRLPSPDGTAGYIGLRRDAAELAITTEASPRMLAGVEPGPGPRHELFVYVDDVDGTIGELERDGETVVQAARDMPWGERVGFVADPEGNMVSLAAPAADEPN